MALGKLQIFKTKFGISPNFENGLT